jgi:hypothetical protein
MGYFGSKVKHKNPSKNNDLRGDAGVDAYQVGFREGWNLGYFLTGALDHKIGYLSQSIDHTIILHTEKIVRVCRSFGKFKEHLSRWSAPYSTHCDICQGFILHEIEVGVRGHRYRFIFNS